MTAREYIDRYFSESEKVGLPDTALFLIGSNPLPLYAAALALQPGKILLLGTPEVLDVMDRFKRMPGLNVIGEATCDGADSQEIQQKAASLMKGTGEVWLFYTAGTKAMAVHGHEVWKNLLGHRHPHWAVYLSPEGPRFWFDTIGRAFSLSPSQRNYSVPEPSLKDIFELHQISPEHYRDCHLKPKFMEVADRIHEYIFKHGMPSYMKLLPPCFCERFPVPVPEHGVTLNAKGEMSFLRDAANFIDGSFFCRFPMQAWIQALDLSKSSVNGNDLDQVRECISMQSQAPKHDRRKKDRADLLKWLSTEWLESWVAQALVESRLFRDVHDSFTFLIPGSTERSEVDVCAMRGHTPFVLSCTVDDTSSLGKHKLFEVRLRANQLGGDHARAAVVCFSENPGKIEKQLNQGWAGHGTIKVFGKTDITNSKTFIEQITAWVEQLEV